MLCYAMILGREPTQLLRQSAVLLALATPHLCFGQSGSKQGENTWTTPSQTTKPQSPAEPRSSTTDTQPPAGELSDPWSADHSGQVESPVQQPAESSELVEPSRDDLWDDYENEPLHHAAPPYEAYRSKNGRTLVPDTALWLGVGAGWTFPFGDLWGTCRGVDSFGQCASVSAVRTRDYVAPGPALELDVGARLARHYNLYGLWEHSWLGSGSATSADRGQPAHADSDFFALGLRVSTDPEQVGFMLDLAVGSRRMRAQWSDGTQLQFTEAPLETRLGIGADVRLNDSWSLAPLLYLGVGSFGKVQWVNPDGTVQKATQPGDIALSHGWVGLQMAVHVDAFGTR